MKLLYLPVAAHPQMVNVSDDDPFADLRRLCEGDVVCEAVMAWFRVVPDNALQAPGVAVWRNEAGRDRIRREQVFPGRENDLASWVVDVTIHGPVVFSHVEDDRPTELSPPLAAAFLRRHSRT